LNAQKSNGTAANQTLVANKTSENLKQDMSKNSTKPPNSALLFLASAEK